MISIKKQIDTVQSEFEEGFNRLGFPIPQKGEYHHRTTRVTFFNPFGFTLRFSNREKYPLIRHQHIARPLGSINIHKFRMDIVPARPLVRLIADARTVFRNLERDGVQAPDIAYRTDNCFTLDEETDEFPNGFAVAFDPTSIQTDNTALTEYTAFPETQFIDFSIPASEKPDIQDTAFSDLRNLFSQAVQNADNGNEPDKENFKNFLGACVKAKDDRRLVNDWLNEPDPNNPAEVHLRRRLELCMNYHPLRDSSLRYERRLSSAGLC